MQQFIDGFFNLAILERTWWYVLQGFGMTLQLCLVVVPVGLAFAAAAFFASRDFRRAAAFL